MSSHTIHKLLGLALLLAACGPARVETSDPTPTLPPLEANNEGGVEAALVTYSDAAQGFAIGYPSPWTRDTAVTSGVRLVGGDDSLTLTFVTLPAGGTPLTYAQDDVAAVSAAFPDFKQLSLAESTEVAGAVILGFEAGATSTVTGKTYTAHDERYYLPLADGRLAVLTVAGPSTHYDREGVRDIALTLKVSP